MTFSTKRVGDVIEEIAMGPFGSNIKVDCFVSSGVPVLNGSNLTGFSLTEETFNYVTFEKATSLKRAVASRGDIVITHRGTLGQIVYIPSDSKHEKYVISQSQFRVRCKESVMLPEFMVYFFHSREGQHRLLSNSSQVGVPALARPSSTFQELEMPVPTIKEQRVIIDTLSALNTRIYENRKINHHLEQMAQAIFKSWFVDFEPFGGVIPGDWKPVTLGELCETVTKGTTPTTLKKQFVTQGINFVKVESILDDHSLDFSKLAFIDDETNTLLNRSVIRENDIIFTIAGTLGRFAFVVPDLLPANTNQAVAIIRTNTSKINPVTLYSFFIGGLHSDFYTKNIQQAVQQNLSLTTIKALPLLLPPLGTLSEYSLLIEPLFEQIFQNYAANRQLAALRDALLPKLMSGELSVADNDEAK